MLAQAIKSFEETNAFYAKRACKISDSQGLYFKMSDAGLHTRESASPTAFEQKIVKQIEYYFGDKNLPRDKFLLQKIEEDDGWVTLECMLKFNRLRTFVEEAIGNSLRKFGSGLLEVNESNTKLRRVKPLPEDTEEANTLAKEKTIYCKGFPESATLDDIEEFFEDKGKCIFIKMRRRLEGPRNFKGSVFVEFATKDEADAFLAMKDLKYGDTELVYLSKDAYFKSKREQRGKKHHDEKEANKKVKSEPDQEQESKVLEYEKGCVIHLSGAGEQTSREDIKELFNMEGISVAWVDFQRGDKEGYVRFRNAGDGEKAISAAREANNNKVTLRGVETIFRVIEGDEEKDYWVKVQRLREGQKKRGGKKNFQRYDRKRIRQEKEKMPHEDGESDEPPRNDRKRIKQEQKETPHNVGESSEPLPDQKGIKQEKEEKPHEDGKSEEPPRNERKRVKLEEETLHKDGESDEPPLNNRKRIKQEEEETLHKDDESDEPPRNDQKIIKQEEEETPQ